MENFWPQKIDFRDILINSFWSFIAWFIWSISMFLIIFLLSWFLNIWNKFSSDSVWLDTSSAFPIILSVIAFIWTSISIYLTYFMLNKTYESKYKKNVVIFWQLAFFWILVYIFMTPIYIYLWLENYNNIIYVFLIHSFILSFWSNLIIEILNNYRYVLLWFYSSFIALFFSSVFILFLFSSFSNSYAKLISLVLLLPILNFSMTFFKQIFENLYYLYYKNTNLDQIGDIFTKIEFEEEEKMTLEEEKNLI